MKILVTGGLGFIGSNFIKYALSKFPEIEIINIDKVGFGANPANLKDLENVENYRFVRGDITDQKIVTELIKKSRCGGKLCS